MVQTIYKTNNKTMPQEVWSSTSLLQPTSNSKQTSTYLQTNKEVTFLFQLGPLAPVKDSPSERDT